MRGRRRRRVRRGRLSVGFDTFIPVVLTVGCKWAKPRGSRPPILPKRGRHWIGAACLTVACTSGYARALCPFAPWCSRNTPFAPPSHAPSGSPRAGVAEVVTPHGSPCGSFSGLRPQGLRLPRRRRRRPTGIHRGSAVLSPSYGRLKCNPPCPVQHAHKVRRLAGHSPLCDIPLGCCSFTGPWTVTRSSLRMLRRVATFCRLLRPVLLLVSFPRSRSPVVGVLGLCWMWHGVPFACQWRPIVGVLRMCLLLPGSFDCVCCPHTSVHRPSIACLAVFLCGPGALFVHAVSGPSTICPFPPHGWSAPDGLPLLLRKQPIWAAGDTPHLMPVEPPPPWTSLAPQIHSAEDYFFSGGWRLVFGGGWRLAAVSHNGIVVERCNRQ